MEVKITEDALCMYLPKRRIGQRSESIEWETSDGSEFRGHFAKTQICKFRIRCA